jgi:flavin-dependent dehydrogenase
VDAAFEPDGVTLRYAGPDGVERTTRVAAVVDASGRAGFLARKLGRYEQDPVLEQIAVHAQYEGVPRAEGRPAGDIRVLTRPDVGWIWLIPISETVMSVGAVVPTELHRREGKATAEESLDHYLRTTPASPTVMRDARRVSPARFDADYSYLATRMAGDRWVAVGDSGSFLDPIFSTGVLMAMQSGIEAGLAMDEGLRCGDLSRRRFLDFERTVRRRYRHFRRFACGFYDPAFRDLFFSRTRRLGVYEAVLSVMAGNWRPSLATRLRLQVFFVLVAVQRHFAITPRVHSESWAKE